MQQNSTPFDVTAYDKQIKRTLPFYEEMVQQVVDIVRLLDSHIRRYGKNYFPMSISESIGLLKNCGFRMVEILWVSYMQAGILARK